MVIHGVWKCWMWGRRREEEMRRKEMERGEEKKCGEGRKSARTHAWRTSADGGVMDATRTRTECVRVNGLFQEWRVRVMCASAQIGLCQRHNVGAAQAQLSGKMHGGWNFSIHAYARIARACG